MDCQVSGFLVVDNFVNKFELKMFFFVLDYDVKIILLVMDGFEKEGCRDVL